MLTSWSLVVNSDTGGINGLYSCCCCCLPFSIVLTEELWIKFSEYNRGVVSGHNVSSVSWQALPLAHNILLTDYILSDELQVVNNTHDMRGICLLGNTKKVKTPTEMQYILHLAKVGKLTRWNKKLKVVETCGNTYYTWTVLSCFFTPTILLTFLLWFRR